MFVLFLLLLPGVRSDVPTPSSLLSPRNFNHHPFDAVKFVKSRPVKKGPILFPNDAPPPPPTPLIVTSRPLSESIARSELNPNNTLTAQSQLNHVSYYPQFLTRVSNYKPFPYVSSTPVYPYVSTAAPYTDARRFQGVRDDHFYTDYEDLNRDHDRRMFYDDEDRSLELRVHHRSLYSRENDYNDDPLIRRTRQSYSIHRSNPTYRASESEDKKHRDVQENENKSRRNNRPKFESSVERKEPDKKSAKDSMSHSVPPLYLSDRVNNQLSMYRRPNRQFQQRFKTKDRYGIAKKTPDYAQYDVKDRDSSKDYHHGENYAFSYTVKDRKTGDDFSHSQQSTGSATNGEYRVRLPDGRMQIVSYTADENGYKADVRYDGHDNSIDAPETSRERYNNKHPVSDARTHYNDRGEIPSHEFPVNQKYLINDKTQAYNYESKRPTVLAHKSHDSNAVSVNDFSENNEYIDRSNEGINADKSGDLTQHNKEYLEHYIERNALSNEKIDRAHDTDYFHYTDEIPFSKEIKDYSSEFNVGYQPHQSKFSEYDNQKTVKPTVKPTYEELKNLFVTNYRRKVPELLPIVSTFKPNYETTTENVVVISPKKSNLYTNIRDLVSVTPAPLPYSTPSSYLVSTIANLKSKVNLINKPILSNKFIEKINKYLTYK